MAKDVITRFKLETTGFDSKIKEAAKELSAYSKTATQAKEGFNQFTKANVDAAKALGTMATSTTNVKDRAKELVGAFNDAAKAYNSLTKEQQQSDWAKALAGSLTQLQQRIKETKQEMQGLNNSMGDMGGGGIFSGLGSKMEGALAVFGGNLMTKAAGAVAQLGSEMADMVKQGIEMAKAGEGVRIAFERLGRGDILNGLREATHGTVTDLELMKAAVKFNDFKLPLDELGTMLAFAQQKAKDTGQSVDYMVDSIVTGLGRKSLMILDNLGLSATEIRERMKETGDMTKAVGAIIRDQMQNAGDYVETAADRAAQANVSLQNKMEELGRKFAPVEEASNQLWTSMKIGILDIIGGPLARLLNTLTEAGRLQNALNDINGDGSGGSETRTDKALRMLREYSGRGSEGKKDLYNRQVAKFQEQEERAWRKVNEARKKYDDELKKSQKRNSASGVAGGTANMALTGYENAIKKAEAEAKAFQIARATYEKGAQDILNPKPVITGTGGTTDTKKTGGKTKEDIKYADDSIMAQEKLISDLTQKWKTASGELRDGYLKDLDEAKAKLKEMTDVADPLKAIEAQFPDKSASNYDTGYQGSQQAKEDGIRGDFAYSREAFQQAPISTQGVEQFISETKSLLSQANIGSELYAQLSEQLSDSSQVSQLLQQYVANGITGADLGSTAQELKAKLMNGEIDDETMQQYVDQLNEKLKEKFDETEWPNVLITFDADTKKIVNAAQQQQKEAQEMAKDWRAAGSAIQAVGAAMNQIEDPAAKVLGTIAQAVATMALSYSQAALATAPTGWGWIAFAATGLATMLTSVNAIKQATAGFAGGGIYDGPSGFVPGNKYSGDLIPANGGTVGLSSGELILNRAQQGVIAQELEGGGFDNLQLDARVSAEDIIFILNNNGNRRGYGDFIND